MGEVDEREHFHAEYLDVCERLVLAPLTGVFSSHYPRLSAATPAHVNAGDEIGVVLHSGQKHAVRTPFTGLLLGLLVLPGERVRSLQPVAWMTTDDGERGASVKIA